MVSEENCFSTDGDSAGGQEGLLSVFIECTTVFSLFICRGLGNVYIIEIKKKKSVLPEETSFECHLKAIFLFYAFW